MDRLKIITQQIENSTWWDLRSIHDIYFGERPDRWRRLGFSEMKMKQGIIFIGEIIFSGYGEMCLIEISLTMMTSSRFLILNRCHT